MKALAPAMTLVLVAAIVIVSVWTPLTHPSVATRWFSFPNIIFFSPVPVLVVATTWVMLRVLRHETHASPFLLALLLLFLGYTGLAISLWPNIIPPAISIREAAGPPESMGFTLVGALFVIPFILAYTAMVVLRIPRKGESRRGVSLMNAHPPAVAPTWLRRVGWLVLIWTASVLALGVVAGLFRVVMRSRRADRVKLKISSRALRRQKGGGSRARDPERGGYRFGGWQPEAIRRSIGRHRYFF